MWDVSTPELLVILAIVVIFIMGRLGLPELLVILAIIIVIFGANRLPGLGRGIGDAIRGFKGGRIKTDEDDKDDKNRKAS